MVPAIDESNRRRQTDCGNFGYGMASSFAGEAGCPSSKRI
jgi:hypothetical protein